jgi:HEAT repeat protein
MSVTMQEIRALLDAEEVDYEGAATMLGPDALPLLRELADGPDAMLASKAIYLAGVIGGDGAMPVLEVGAAHDDAVRRVAAASALARVAEPAAEPLVDRLLSDDDMGVRKTALKSAAGFRSEVMQARVQQAADNDPEPILRDIAARALQER